MDFVTVERRGRGKIQNRSMAKPSLAPEAPAAEAPGAEKAPVPKQEEPSRPVQKVIREDAEKGQVKKKLSKSWADVHSDDEDEDDLFPSAAGKARPPPPEPEAETTVGETSEAETSEGAGPRSPVAMEPPMAQPAQFDEWQTVGKKKKGKEPRREEAWQQPTPAPWAKAARPQPAARDLGPRPGPAKAGGGAAVSAVGNGKDRAVIQVGLEDTPEFPVARRIIGPQGANLKRIRERCGAVISLRGRGCPGSGTDGDRNEPLHLVINAAPKDLAQAVELATALVEDVRRQYRNRDQ